MGGRSSSSNLAVTPINRPLSETWRDNIPENATPAQRRMLERLFDYGNTQYGYLKLEYTTFDISAIERTITPEERELLRLRQQPPTIQVSFMLERTDREQSPLLNAMDMTSNSVLIGPRGGMYSYDGAGHRETLSIREATSRTSIEDRRARDSRQYERRRRRRS